MELRTLKHSTTHPKYLHSNSTSHIVPFGAIAELADNSTDAEATHFLVDAEPEECPDRLFQDDGTGLTPTNLHRMLSFGHCDKVDGVGNKKFIGHYGNGFKSGSMRLGKDALVFTRDGKLRSIGFLSQTFLADVGADEVLVPMLSWDDITLKPVINTLEEGIDEETALKIFNDNLGVILKYTPYKTEEDIHKNIDKIKSSTGTRIVVLNLKKNETNDYEFDFSLTDDILLSENLRSMIALPSGRGRAKDANNEPPPELYSLYAFLSTLYLNPKMNMYIKGHKVRAKKFVLSLYKPKSYSYKPSSSGNINITYGFNKQSKQHFGMMLYHKNRLIKSYIRVGYQLNPDSRGVGVIGVCEASFLQPTHNKQDFICDNNYRLLINALKDRLTTYWSDCEIGSKKGLSISELWVKLANSATKGPWWVQCDNVRCLKWRKVNADPSNLPENWVCSMNNDTEFDDCSCPEEDYNIDSGKRTRVAGVDLRKKLESQINQDEEKYKSRMEKKKQRLRTIKAQELAKATGFSFELCQKALTKKDDDREASFKWLVKNGKENGEKGDKEKLRKVWREIKEEKRKKQLKEQEKETSKSKKQGKKRKHDSSSSDDDSDSGSDSEKGKKKNKKEKEKDRKKSKKTKKEEEDNEEDSPRVVSDSEVAVGVDGDVEEIKVKRKEEKEEKESLEKQRDKSKLDKGKRKDNERVTREGGAIVVQEEEERDSTPVVKVEKMSDNADDVIISHSVTPSRTPSSSSSSSSSSSAPLAQVTVVTSCVTCADVRKKLSHLHHLFELPWEFSDNLNEFDEKRIFEDIKARFVHEQEVVEAKINIYEDYLREIGVDPSSLYAVDGDPNQPAGSPTDNEYGGMLESETDTSIIREERSTLDVVGGGAQNGGDHHVPRSRAEDRTSAGSTRGDSEGETEGEMDTDADVDTSSHINGEEDVQLHSDLDGEVPIGEEIVDGGLLEK